MVDIKHAEPGAFGRTEIDRVIEEIREIRENQDLRFSTRHQTQPDIAQSDTAPLDAAQPDLPPDEALPLFLSSPDDQDTRPSDDWPSYTWEQDSSQHDAWLRDVLQRDAPQRDARPQEIHQDTGQDVARDVRSAWPEDIRTQDRRQQVAWQQDTRRQDDWQQDGTWLREAAEIDRERPEATSRRPLLKRVLRVGILTGSIAAALAALFTLVDQRSLVSNASAAIAAVLPGFSASVDQPASAKEETAAIRAVPVTTIAVPVVREAAPVAPTRQAISVAYQTALQGQPEIRQPPAAPSPPQSAPVRRLDPDELAALLKRAQGLIDTGDLTSARLLLARAADAHEARAAFILAQTYDPDVLGTADARSITPDPATARLWYQKAASFGSPEAQLRLAQMNN